MKLVNRNSVLYNNKIVTRDDKSLSEVERKLLFASVPDYTQGGIVSGHNGKMPKNLMKCLRRSTNSCSNMI